MWFNSSQNLIFDNKVGNYGTKRLVSEILYCTDPLAKPL